MSKAVMISIRPKWCEKIARGKKTIEVRKTRPKLETPFKCYIYCTNIRPFLVWGEVFRGDWFTEFTRISGYSRAEADKIWDVFNGHIAGEFTCDRIYELETRSPGGSYYVKGEDQPTTNDVARKSCLTLKDMHEYLQAKVGYGWHISELKIYDTPKDLGEFERPYECDLCTAKWASECNACHGNGKIKRPPQSWCYVEEQK
jgi:predicted transcriptional regulator